MTKAAAVAKYSKLVAAEASREEVQEAVTSDEKNFSADEVSEIMEALYAPVKDAGASGDPLPEKGNPNAMKKFEKYQAKGVYKFRLNEDTGDKEQYLAEVTKLGAPISTHNIEQRHADELNSQLDNSGFYYFPKA